MQNTFKISDYVIFCLFLLVSLGIGVFFSLRGDKQRSQSEYFLGGRKMHIVPVAISIFVSFQSGIMIVGIPAEIYAYGISHWLIVIGMVLSILFGALLFVPLMHPLKLTSVSEYLELRYHSVHLRRYCTCITFIVHITVLGLIMLAPAMALETVSGIPSWAGMLLMTVIGTIYTSIGGMKAVVWTDVFQGAIILAGVIAIVIQASIQGGGFNEVLRVGIETKRVSAPSFSPDPRIRHSFWTLVFGIVPSYMAVYGVSQPTVQRIQALPTRKGAILAILLNIPAVFLVVSLCEIAGLAIVGYYASVKKCDLLASGLLPSPNMVLPYFVINELGKFPGFPGLFIAALYAGALSTMSSVLNGMSAMLWEDFLKPVYGNKWSDRKATNITKVVVAVFGLVAFAVGMLCMEVPGTIIQIASSILGATSGPLLGTFMLGMFFPCANTRGTFIGAVFGYILPVWIVLGQNLKKIYALPLPGFTTAGCPSKPGAGLFNHSAIFSNVSAATYTVASSTGGIQSVYTTPAGNFTPMVMLDTTDRTGLDGLYSISYCYYGTIGMMSTIIIGLVASFATGRTKPSEVDARYVVPYFDRICCCLPNGILKLLRCGVDYDSVEKDESQEDVHEVVDWETLNNNHRVKDFKPEDGEEMVPLSRHDYSL